MNTITVKFDDFGKEYAFKNFHEGIEVGDQVVVDTRHGYALAKVRSVTEGVHIKATKYVVQKVDDSQLKAHIELDEKRDKIKKKMEDRRKKLQEMEIYRILAKEDAEMAELLEQLGDDI